MILYLTVHLQPCKPHVNHYIIDIQYIIKKRLQGLQGLHIYFYFRNVN